MLGKLFFLLAVSVVSMSGAVLGQDAAQRVELAAADGLTLIGDYYAPPGDTLAPAVLLLHMLGSDRAAWGPLLPALQEAGYAVLAVDHRGHGETGGSIDWTLAQEDNVAWLTWLRSQPGVRPEAVSLVGASVGANLALMNCAADEACVTAVALSPGLDFQGLMPETALVEGLAERSALLIATHSDRESAEAVRQMTMNARGEIAARLWRGTTHGTTMFTSPRTRRVLPQIIVDWLNQQQPAA